MKLIPKKTKFKLRFRTKLQTERIIKYDLRLSRAICLTKAWVPSLPQLSSLNKVPMVPGHLFQNHDSTTRLLYGSYGIAFEKHANLRSSFISTIRLDIAKLLKKQSKVWLRICCDTPVTARPVESRMGKGKGAISYWQAKVCPGQIFFEFHGITKDIAHTIFQNLTRKCSVPLRLISPNKI
jgi:large subunit ribosomal protein L16